jgi:tRNA dimethylallyltransferase
VSGRLIAIVGPTGVGKSAEALQLAGQFNGEIVSADSRQVYRHMDIGTAKPSIAEQRQAAHHLIDIREPDQPFSLGEYQVLAIEAVNSVFAGVRVPFLVGGTGQYVWSVLENWSVPRIAPDVALREKLEERAREGEPLALHDELKGLNPEAASRIDPRNVRRVIRALEIAYCNGPEPAKQSPVFDYLIIGLTAPRAELHRRIDARIKNMLGQGLAAEVEMLLAAGYGPELPAMSGIGYRQMVRCLKGEITLPAAIESMNIDSHRLVRQQYNWFKPSDSRIHWFDVTCGPGVEIIELVKGFLCAPQLS